MRQPMTCWTTGISKRVSERSRRAKEEIRVGSRWWKRRKESGGGVDVLGKLYKMLLARLSSGRNKHWTAWNRRNIWKQHGHPRGARKIAIYRERTQKCVAEEANMLNSFCQHCTISCWEFSGSSVEFQSGCWFYTLPCVAHLAIATSLTDCLAGPWPCSGGSVFSAKEAAAAALASRGARAQAV